MALADCFTKSDPEAGNNQGTATNVPLGMRLWKMRFLRAFVWILRMSHDKIKEWKYSNLNGSISGKN
jgi:hypothetical protein